MKIKPKIDIETLRIEITEDDLFTSRNIRTFTKYNYVLRDDFKIYAFGSDKVDEFIRNKFGLNGAIKSRFGTETILLKNILMDFYTNSLTAGNNPYIKVDFLSFHGPITVHRDGWELAGIYSTKH